MIGFPHRLLQQEKSIHHYFYGYCESFRSESLWGPPSLAETSPAYPTCVLKSMVLAGIHFLLWNRYLWNI